VEFRQRSVHITTTASAFTSSTKDRVKISACDLENSESDEVVWLVMQFAPPKGLLKIRLWFQILALDDIPIA
jgi:hypothetical protein